MFCLCLCLCLFVFMFMFMYMFVCFENKKNIQIDEHRRKQISEELGLEVLELQLALVEPKINMKYEKKS